MGCMELAYNYCRFMRYLSTHFTQNCLVGKRDLQQPVRGRQGSALIENALGHLESNIAAAVQDRFPLEKLEKAQ